MTPKEIRAAILRQATPCPHCNSALVVGVHGPPLLARLWSELLSFMGVSGSRFELLSVEEAEEQFTAGRDECVAMAVGEGDDDVEVVTRALKKR